MWKAYWTFDLGNRVIQKELKFSGDAWGHEQACLALGDVFSSAQALGLAKELCEADVVWEAEDAQV